MDGMKMSKSLGNILYIRDLLKKYPGETLRLTLLSCHYRQPLNFNDKAIQQCQTMLDKLYRVLRIHDEVDISDYDTTTAPKEILDALSDDLNSSKAIAEINKIATNLSKSDGEEIKKNKALLLAAGNVFGILQSSPNKWLGYDKDSNVDVNTIEKLLKERELARKERNFSKADQIRSELKEMNIEIEDTPKGSIWRKIS
jgi:cysteinyl-tRNA synthetase